jgi:predicted RNA binding protein YcfA (HicA-like mRNA interferase family)
MQDVGTLLVHFGFTLARISGSHHIYEYDDGQRFRQITVPLHGHKVKKAYVQQISELLDELFPEEPGVVEAEDEGMEDDSNEQDA